MGIKEDITKIYIGYYDRAPDPAGLNYWIGRANAGMTLSEIAASFAVQPESTAKYPYLANPLVASAESFVVSIYMNLFNRAPDDAGKAHWIAELAAGKPVGQMIIDIMSGAKDDANGNDLTTLNNKVAVGVDFAEDLSAIGGLDYENNPAAKAAAAAALDGVTDVAATIDTAKAATDAFVAAGAGSGQAFTLTAGADAGPAFTGAGGPDVFTGTEATLSSADALDGAGGNDTLNYSSSGPAAVNEAGFTLSNIERVNVTSDATGGTTFDATGTTGVTILGNTNSSTGVTVNGATALAGLELTNVSGGNTTLNYQASVVAGAADVQSLTVNNVHSNAGIGVSGVSVGGVETLNVMTTGGASLLTAITGPQITTVNLSGDQNITVAGTMPGTITTFDASGLTGGAMFDMTFNAGGLAPGNIAFNGVGSAGNDTFKFGSTLSLNDKVDAGAGDKDVIGFNVIGDVNPGLQLTNFEHASFANATGGTLDMDNLPGINQLFLNNGLNAAVTFDDAANDLVVDLNQGAGNFGGNSLTIDHKTDTAADKATLNVDIATNDGLGVVTLTDAETFTLDIDSNDGNDTLTIGNLLGPDLNGSTLNITGDGHLMLTAATAANLAKVEAATSTGNLNINALGGGATALTINTGSGNDLVTGSTKADTINTGAGNDVVAGTAGADTIDTGAGKDIINGSAGANKVTGGADADTFVYAAGSLAATAALSNNANGMDTITDFKSGEDRLNLDALTVEDGTLGGPTTSFAAGVNATTTKFVGNQDSFGLAQGALRGGGNSDVVYQKDANILWIDTDGNGTLDDNDFRIKLDGTASLTDQDLGINLPGVTFTANKVGFNTAVAADSDEGTVTGNGKDTINSTNAFLAGSTINGLNGTDTLNVTTTHTGGLLSTASVETVNLKMGSSANTSFNGAVTTVTADKAAQVDLVAGNVAYTGSDEVDVANNVSGSDSVDAKGGNDTVNTGGVQTGALKGGAGTDTLNVATGGNISGAAVSGFELANLVGTATMTAAQHGSFILLNGVGGANTVTITDTFNGVGNATVESYDLNGTNNTFTMATVGQNVNAGGGNDIVNVIAGNLTGTIAGEGGNDTLNINGVVNITAATVSSFLDANLGNNGNLTLDDSQLGGITGVNDNGTNTGITILDANNSGFVKNLGTSVSSDYDADSVAFNGAGVRTTAIDDGFSGTLNSGGAGSTNANYATGTHTSIYNGQGGNDSVSFSGTLSGAGRLLGGAGADLLTLNNASSISGVAAADVAGFETVNLQTNSTTTMLGDHLDTFLAVGAANFNATGTETVNITDTTFSTTIDNDTAGPAASEEIETYNFTSTSAHNVALLDTAASSQTINVNLAAGAANQVTLNNATHETLGNNSEFVINGFEAASDDILLQLGGVAYSGGFQTINSAAEDLTVGNMSVVEINTGVATALDLQDVSANGGIEGIIAGAIANSTGTMANGEDLSVVIYDAAGNAGLYDVDVTTANADLGAADITVELVGILNGVGADALGAANFA